MSSPDSRVGFDDFERGFKGLDGLGFVNIGVLIDTVNYEVFGEGHGKAPFFWREYLQMSIWSMGLINHFRKRRL